MMIISLSCSWNVKSAASQLLASLTERIFRARRTSGESECANRVSSLAINLEFPNLRNVMIHALKEGEEHEMNSTGHVVTKRCVFAVGID